MGLKYPRVVSRAGRLVSPAGRTLWCGPFAVAVLTGTDYDSAYEDFLAVERRAARRAIMAQGVMGWPPEPADVDAVMPKDVDATYPVQLARALQQRGVRVSFNVPQDPAPTLLRFVREQTIFEHTYIIHCGGHWLTVHEGEMYHAPHRPLPVEKAPRYRMAKVHAWADVRPLEEAFD